MLRSDRPLKIFVIAGEKSGDVLAGDFLRSLRGAGGSFEVRGIGSDEMLSSGLLESSLFPMDELSLMGIAEIVPQLPNLIKRINQTVKAIETFSPDVLLTVDAPDFSFRVQKKIRARGIVTPHQVHYVAPTVWAWREGRAKKIAKFLDQVLCLFPFEPSYFEKVGLRADFVGHSMLEHRNDVSQSAGDDFIKAESVSASAKVLGVFLGSRSREVGVMLDLYRSVLMDVAKIDEDIELVIPTFPRFVEQIKRGFSDLPFKLHFVTDKSRKWDAFAAMDAAMATSGTVGLELAVSGVPHLITYRMNGLTAFFARRMIKVKYAHLANIMRNEMIVPEFIQEDCVAENIAPALHEILFDSGHAKNMKDSLRGIADELKGVKDERPSVQCVEAILGAL